ncbi:MAG: hypothetical protein F4039_06495 [Gammaproteobacteria bacterium]|nr:hypothetical protein [Gammaproteobacteria bacterium]MYF52956.1 hypothetical protein [Gammaproteobacteria bacterium]MYK43717.1 hypothetical protein [Gammaproteobacteria bacterium]
MKFDQWMQLLTMIPTWLASFGTIAATCVALYLAWRSERIKLHGIVGLRTVFGTSFEKKVVSVGITNLSYRQVTLKFVSFYINNKIITFDALNQNLPKTLVSGEGTTVLIDIQHVNDCFTQNADLSLQTLVLRIQTSIGKAIDIRPENALIEHLERVRQAAKL